MNRFLLLVVGLVGCTSSSSEPEVGTYTVAWSLAAPATCAASKIDSISVTVTDKVTNDTVTVSAPCEAGTLKTSAIALGSHTITLDAIGTAGDIAGEEITDGAILKANDDITLPPTSIAVLPPTASEHTTWTLTRAGAAIDCSQIEGQDGVSVTVTPAGGSSVTDLWDCGEFSAIVDVPYGDFSVTVDVIDAQEAVIASGSVDAPAGRGVLDTVVPIDVP